MEQQLRDVLAAVMQDVPAATGLLDGANAPLGTFSARIAACYALALISESEHHDLNQLRRIRNAFAHDIHTTFDAQSVKDRCATLKLKAHDYDSAELGEVRMTPQGQFQTAAVALIMNLVNRPHYAVKERRTPKQWPY
ncbi:MAG: transcriptional regulator [Hyphomicrobiaceae bacterium]